MSLMTLMLIIILRVCRIFHNIFLSAPQKRIQSLYFTRYAKGLMVWKLICGYIGSAAAVRIMQVKGVVIKECFSPL